VNGRYKGHPTEKQRAIKGGQKSTVQVVDGGKEYNLTKSEAYYRENDETKSKCGFKYFRYEILDKSSDLYREGVWVGQGFQYRPQNSPAVSPHAGERMSEHVPEHTQLHGELPLSLSQAAPGWPRPVRACPEWLHSRQPPSLSAPAAQLAR
jgi:hypothetical protein